MNNDFVLKDAHLVLGDEVVRGTVAVAGGVIAAVDSGGTAALGATALDGDLLIPGCVELHTDNFERHLMPRPQVRWAELPALIAHDAEVSAAGITTVLDALGVGDTDEDALRGTDWRSVVQCLDDCVAADLLRADHLLHVRCELPAPNTIRLFEAFREHPKVKLLSLMDHTPGQRQWENIEQARVYYTGKKGWSNHKFEQQVSNARVLQEEYALPHRAFFVDYCRTRGIELASHDDTTQAHVHEAQLEGISISEFPTSIAAALAAREHDLSIVMGAPNVVRGGSHSGNVAALQLAQLDLLDVLSSDYVPGSLLMAAFRLVEEAGFALPKAIATVSRNPACAVGLHDRGAIAAGLRADLVQVRLITGADGIKQPVVRAVWRSGRRVL
jgi:alpha-D-ribose 1-methylphosphonate 5-triphosphate diphosphatase